MKADADYHDYLQDMLDAADKVGSARIRFVVTRIQNIYRPRAAVKRRRAPACNATPGWADLAGRAMASI